MRAVSSAFFPRNRFATQFPISLPYATVSVIPTANAVCQDRKGRKDLPPHGDAFLPAGNHRLVLFTRTGQFVGEDRQVVRNGHEEHLRPHRQYRQLPGQLLDRHVQSVVSPYGCRSACRNQIGAFGCGLQSLELPLQRFYLADVFRLIHFRRLGYDFLKSHNFILQSLNTASRLRGILVHGINPAGNSGESLAGIVLYEEFYLDGFHCKLSFD